MSRLLGRLSQRISHFVMAVKTSARGRWSSVPLQALRIVACWLFYRIGQRSYCLYRLDRKPVRTWRTYTDDVYEGYKEFQSINPGHLLVDDKIAFHRECLKHGLRTVAILGLFAEKSTPGSDADPPLVRDPAHLQRLLEANPDGLFVKPRDGSFGEGAFAILPHSGNWRFPGGIGTVHDVFEYCVSCAKAARAYSWIEGDNTLLVQPRLITCDALRGVMAPDTFGTVRAVTYMHDQRPTLMAAVLKIVVEGNVADNFHHGATGNLAAPLDPLTGASTAVRGSRSRTWPVIFDSEIHPTTGIRLVGMQVPRWSDVRSLLLRAQACFSPRLRTLGWDVGVTQEGPLLVEGNARYYFDLFQLAFDRGFAPDFERVMLASHAN